MFTMLVSIFTWVSFVIIWFTVSVVVGIYILIDSKKHQMKTVFWVLIGLVFNVFGLCAYFIARERSIKKYCPVCRSKTEEYDTFCPACDVKLETVRPKMKLITKIFIGVCIFFAAAIILSEVLGRIMA